MGFEQSSVGINESTLTSLAYICYLAAFVFYAVHLFTVHPGCCSSSGTVAMAGAGGGTMDMTISGGDEARASCPQTVFAYAGLGRFWLVLLAWVSLTTALGMRWVESGHPPYVTLYEISTMLVWGTTTIYLILFEGVLKVRAAGAFVVLLIFCLQSFCAVVR